MLSFSISGASGARRRRSRARSRHPGWPAGGFLDLEERLAACGMGLVAGVDEAGRGPLAGPVVASAVILDAGRIPPGIKDSKQLTASARARLYDAITARAVGVGVGVVPPEVIDRANILEATLEAMVKAVLSLGTRPDCVVVDGRNLPCLPVPVVGLVKGDSRCVSVAAASIVAKVTRDNIMLAMDAVYPQYGFGRNKGYGTPDHIEALRHYGPTRIHRFSFEPVLASLGARLEE